MDVAERLRKINPVLYQEVEACWSLTRHSAISEAVLPQKEKYRKLRDY